MSENCDRLKIDLVGTDKKRFLPLLLEGDESERMIDRYIDRGNMYVASIEGNPVAVAVTTEEGEGTVEIKNLAVHSDFRRRGIGRKMLEHVERLNYGKILTLGTGETPSTLRFYESFGFRYSHRVKNFFTDNYENPIIEEGICLRDMVYLSKKCTGIFHKKLT